MSIIILSKEKKIISTIILIKEIAVRDLHNTLTMGRLSTII